MRKLIPLIILLLWGCNVYSQWGIKGGVNTSTLTGSDMRTYRFSGHIGVTYDIKLTDKWYLQPELLFTSIGCNLKDDGIVLKGGHVSMNTLEIPLNLSFRPKITHNTNLLFEAGLYARYGLFGNKTYKYYDKDLNVDNSPFDAYNRWDMGLNVGLGVQKSHYYGIFSFQRGLTHVQKDGQNYNQVVKFSIGYKF